MEEHFQYSQTTNNILVKVMVNYIGYHDLPNKEYHVWVYTINIENNSDKTVKLAKRHWEIIDNKGIINKIDGNGVVGEQPVLKTNEIFEYTSGTYLNTHSGIMKGYYDLYNCDDNKENTFKVIIPAFSLDAPDKGAIN